MHVVASYSSSIICLVIYLWELLCFYFITSKSNAMVNIFIKTLKLWFWPCWVFAAAQAFLWLWRAGATLQGGAQISCCRGFSCCGAPGQPSIAAAHGVSSGSLAPTHRLKSCGTRLTWFTAGGVFLDQESKPCMLHWQADSLLLSFQGSHLWELFSKNQIFVYIPNIKITWMILKLKKKV